MTAQSLKPRLVVLSGESTLAVREIEPGQEWKLGRSPSSDLVIEHPSVSRHHAQITCDASGVRIDDLKTANGTYVNDQRLEGPVTLRSGDLIRLGQVKNPEPILLRFEDPSSLLLEALAEQKSGPHPAAPVASSASAHSSTADAVPAGAVSSEVQSAAAPPPAVAVRPGPLQGLLNILKQPVIIIPIAVIFVVAIAVGMYIALGVRATQKPWQSVRVEPVKLGAGMRVTLRGPEVEPSDRLKIFVQDQEASIEQMKPGDISFITPDIGAGESGVRTVSLRVERKGILVFRQAVQYEIVPMVKDVLPREVAVGDVVTVEGTGFVNDPARVEARIGQMKASVVSATPGQIKVRVPVLTRSGIVDSPIEIRIGEWSASPGGLRVRPRDIQCYRLTLTGGYAAEKVWEIRHLLGVAVYVEGAAPAGSEAEPAAPANVQRTIQNLGSVFEKAGADPTIAFEIRESGGMSGLVATGTSLQRPIDIAQWTRTALTVVKAKTQFEGDATFIPYWNVIVLNEVLNLFGKGQPPVVLPADSPLRPILQKLHDQSIENGGNGCPGPEEIQAMSPAERDQFMRACWIIPNHFGSVEGTWEGELTNASPTADNGVKRVVRLRLSQRGMSLSGSAVIEEVRAPGIKWSMPGVPSIRGTMTLRDKARIEILFPDNRPFRLAKLAGILQGESIEGTYTTDDGGRGSCRLVRTMPE